MAKPGQGEPPGGAGRTSARGFAPRMMPAEFTSAEQIKTELDKRFKRIV